jgi:hypothetical protein
MTGRSVIKICSISLEVGTLAQPGDTASVVMEVMDGTASRPEVLASDADRENIVGQLSSAFAEGRLTAAQHGDRVRAAYSARTVGELARLTADLPGPGGEAGGRQQALLPDGVDRCLMCSLLVCCPPAGIAWLLAARRRARATGGAGAAGR